MIFAPPGLGKSTSAQLLSREHGFVYYECDCFLSGRNPYVPPDVENPSVAQGKQKKLIGRGAGERGELKEKVANDDLTHKITIIEQNLSSLEGNFNNQIA